MEHLAVLQQDMIPFLIYIMCSCRIWGLTLHLSLNSAIPMCMCLTHCIVLYLWHRPSHTKASNSSFKSLGWCARWLLVCCYITRLHVDVSLICIGHIDGEQKKGRQIKRHLMPSLYTMHLKSTLLLCCLISIYISQNHKFGSRTTQEGPLSGWKDNR